MRAVREHFNFNWDKHGSFRPPTPSALHHHGLLNVFVQIGVGTIEIVAIGPALQFSGAVTEVKSWAGSRLAREGATVSSVRPTAPRAGRGPRPAKARWCCSAAREVSANRGSRPLFWNTSPPSHTRGCAISARRSTPTARFIRSSARWNAPPDWRTTTYCKQSSTSSTRCWRRPQPLRRTRRSLPRCCRSRMVDAIPRST